MVFQKTSNGVYVVFYANNSGTRCKVSQIFFLPTGGSDDEVAVSSNIPNGDTTVSGSNRRSDNARLGGNDDMSFNQGRGDVEEGTDMPLTSLQINVLRACELLIGKCVFGDFFFFGTFNLKPIPDGENSDGYKLALAFSKMRQSLDGGCGTDLLRHITDLLHGLGITNLRGIIGAILSVVDQTLYTDFERDGRVKTLSKSKHFTETKNFQVVNDLDGEWSTEHVLSVPVKSNSILDQNKVFEDTNDGEVEYVAKNIALCKDNNDFIVITFAGGQDNYNDGRDELLTWIELKERYEVELGYKVFLVHYEVDNKGRGGYRPLRSVTVSHLFGLPDPNADDLRTCWADGIKVFFRRIGLKDEHGNEYPFEKLRKMKLLQAEDNKCNVNVKAVQQWLVKESPIRFNLRKRNNLTSSGEGQLFAEPKKMFFFITSFRLNGAAITPHDNLHVALFCAKDRFVTDAFGTMELAENEGKNDDLMQQMMKDNWGKQYEYNIKWVYEIQLTKTRSTAQGEKLQEMLRVSKFMECYPDAH